MLDNVARIAARDYVPTHQDILHARKATKGIAEFCVDINGIPFRFVDVGGQRSQRPKWFQCFESVTSILFLVSSSEYDQVLHEDRKTNRLDESVNIFETIVNNRCFSDVSMILFLNKTDVLKEKLERAKEIYGYDEATQSPSDLPIDANVELPPSYETSAMNGTHPLSTPTSGQTSSSSSTSSLSSPIRISLITEFFPNFTGDPFKVDDVQQYMITLFDGVRRERRKSMYHHFTTAIDTENIKYVFNAVRNTILQKNITTLMLQ